MSVTLLLGDCRTAQPEGKYHAMLCDPPYELGFMGKHWDASGVAFDPATWAALAEHLYPGAFGMAFASARGWHRMAVAIEDAGLIIHPTIFNWVYGSGFPKATRIKGRADFDSHRYGLQALKPAAEPIIVFQKPYDGRPIDCITQTGAGALWIDGARIGTSGSETHSANAWGGDIYGEYGSKETIIHNCGRWPANFVLSEDAAQSLDEMSGESKSSPGGMTKFGGMFGNGDDVKSNAIYADSGGASRFFFTYQFDQMDEADPVYYCAKASRSERDAGLDGFERKANRWQTEAAGNLSQGRNPKTGERTGKVITPARNPHPTVKPIALARYLATLLLPPAEYGPRRLLVPFAGVGSEMIGALLAGWEDVTGIEREAEYIEIAKARLGYWKHKAVQPALEGING